MVAGGVEIVVGVEVSVHVGQVGQVGQDLGLGKKLSVGEGLDFLFLWTQSVVVLCGGGSMGFK